MKNTLIVLPTLVTAIFLAGCSEGFKLTKDSNSAFGQESIIPLRQDQLANGDMILERSNLVLRRGTVSTETTAYEYASLEPWADGVLPIVFDETVSRALQDKFFESCRAWMAFTGVRCLNRTSESKYVEVSRRQTGCFSTVGRPRVGNGLINLGVDGCWAKSTVIHEIGHSFGLLHEHQRADRDQWIEIHLENLFNPDFAPDYAIIPSSRFTGDYDFYSIMSYDPLRAAIALNAPVIIAKPQYASLAANMGKTTEPSDQDRKGLASIYNIPPTTRPVSGTIPPLNRADFYNAMRDLDAVYVGELKRPNGLSIDGGPDFLGIAAWIFDIYLSSRAANLTHSESFYNVRAAISNSDEWKGKNPTYTPLPLRPISSPISLDRGEYLDAMRALDRAYRDELGRADGLRNGNSPDFEGIATWIFDIYLNAKLQGKDRTTAWGEVMRNIRASDEYRQRHQ